MQRTPCRFTPLILLSLLSLPALAEQRTEALPLPAVNLPDEPAYPPSVVTAGGTRLLLGHVDVTMRWDPREQAVEVSEPGWWVINYPLSRIEGFKGQSEDEIARKLFGEPASAVRNWYVRTPGEASASGAFGASGASGGEPRLPGMEEYAVPTVPAPIELSESPALWVDGVSPKASDQNDGSAALPLKTIGAAVQRAVPGNVIRVRPGVYRETVEVEKGGIADAPLVIEGERDADGRMPVISGNDLVPADNWEPVDGMDGIFRGPIVTGMMGPMSVDGMPLKEASFVRELQPGEFAYNRASQAFQAVGLNRQGMPEVAGIDRWYTVEADDEGMVELLPASEQGAVVLASTWVWVEPGEIEEGETWDPRFPEPVTGKVDTGGAFRGFRQTGSGVDSQVNQYRMWVNGEPLQSAPAPGRPRHRSDYGQSDGIDNVELREGWNHLAFAFDTNQRPGDTAFRFGVPKGIKGLKSVADEPRDKRRGPGGEAKKFIDTWKVSEPVAAKQDLAVYVRLPGDADPREHVVDMAKRTLLVDLTGGHVHFRGFELRQGAQFQQRAQFNVSGAGSVVEGNLFIHPEVRGLSVKLQGFDQDDPPIHVINNVVISPGGLGIGATGSTDDLTPANQDGPAPGRGRLIAEWNTVIDNNASGYPRFWESGGFKMFRLSGSVLRMNNFIDGDGPGIWLDWEHYNNRIDANFGRNVTGFLIGIEASPGPHLISNNVAVDVVPGGAWFRSALLGWSSARLWAVHNTIDSGYGVAFHEGPDDRETAWRALPERGAALVNSLVIGRPETIHPARLEVIRGNRLYGENQGFGVHLWAEWKQPAVEAQVLGTKQVAGANLPEAYGRERGDFRLGRNSPEADAGVAIAIVETQGTTLDLVQQVRHDFYGLLRFPNDPHAAGAFRVDPPTGGRTTVEVEYTDGRMVRDPRASTGPR